MNDIFVKLVTVNPGSAFGGLSSRSCSSSPVIIIISLITPTALPVKKKVVILLEKKYFKSRKGHTSQKAVLTFGLLLIIFQ